jgi:glycosyltransferase involved in cell wall biosynthesis
VKTTLLIPARNEIEGMKVILPQIKKDWVDEIIVVDGKSTDGSFEYAKSLGITVIRQKSRGITEAYWEALEAARGDVVIPFSPDGNSVPERIPELVQKMREGYDMVIASRYFDGAKSQDDTSFTAFGNWMFTQMINICFGGKYTDALVMFRAWKRELLDQFGMRADSWDVLWGGIEPELAIQCAKRKLKVAEIAGDEPERIGTGRKVNLWRGGLGILILVIKGLFTR